MLKHAKGVQYVHLEKEFQYNVGPESRMELILAVRTVKMERTATIMTNQTVRVATDVVKRLRKGRAPQSKIAFVQPNTAMTGITWIVWLMNVSRHMKYQRRLAQRQQLVLSINR